MRFKTFYLLEASKEYNIAKVMADKLIKLISEIEYSAHKDPKYLKKYKYSNSGMFEVPLKDFINNEFPKDSVFSHLKDGKLYLEYGYMDNSPTPFLWAITTKDGKTSRNKAGAYFEPSKGFLGIHIPFIDPKTDLPYKGFNSHWKTLLIHEFTHYIQDSKERFKEGSSTLSTEDWHKDKHEQEAYLHELYSLFQKWLSTEIEELKYLRTSDKYHEADLPKYIKKNNFLAKLFSSEEMFERKYPIGEIFLDNDKQKKRINYIAGNLKELYKKFIHDTYVELKKEFKNTLPSKELKYTKEEFMFVEYIDTCSYLNESVLNDLEYLLENFDDMFERSELSRIEYPKYGYYIKVESVKHKEDKKPFQIESAYTIDGDKYIGNETMAKFLCKKKNLTKIQPRMGGSGKVCSIGFNDQEQKWYGWSHRAMVGFGIGDKIFEEKYGDDETLFTQHGSKTIKTLDDAKKAASNFAEYVS